MTILSCRKPHALSRQTLRAWGFFCLLYIIIYSVLQDDQFFFQVIYYC